MKCPVCNDVNLIMSERQGIEIDYCPQCRGVWLDHYKGNWTRLSSAPQRQRPPKRRSPCKATRTGIIGHYEKQHKYHKRKSFLSELFD